ncbi:hypothetical protein [Streptomyces sp. NPDC086782]|uniref:hypothetical protein n=1 Tax=Streptomyces sp. NPDC086782 TaxID=3365757 RepID=UPI00380B528D
MLRRYRCDDCGGTSPVCITDGSLLREARRHRILAHDGLIPDGERVVDVPVAKLVDVPRGQLVATAVLFLVLVVAVAVRG